MGHSLGSKQQARKRPQALQVDRWRLAGVKIHPKGLEAKRLCGSTLREHAQPPPCGNGTPATTPPHTPRAPKLPNKPHCSVPGHEVGMSGMQQGGHGREIQKGVMEKEGS